jgi:hypothetical protein
MRQLRHLKTFSDLLYLKSTGYGGEPWITDLLAEMVKFNPGERPSFSTIVEVVEIPNAPSSRSSFPPMSGKTFLNNSIYSGSEVKQNKFPS